MTTAFFFGLICGATIVGLIALGFVGDYGDEIAGLRNELARERDNTWHQVNNVLELADSEQAQRDRERYQQQVMLPDLDWESIFAQVRGVK